MTSIVKKQQQIDFLRALAHQLSIDTSPIKNDEHARRRIRDAVKRVCRTESMAFSIAWATASSIDAFLFAESPIQSGDWQDQAIQSVITNLSTTESLQQQVLAVAEAMEDQIAAQQSSKQRWMLFGAATTAAIAIDVVRRLTK